MHLTAQPGKGKKGGDAFAEKKEAKSETARAVKDSKGGGGGRIALVTRQGDCTNWLTSSLKKKKKGELEKWEAWGRGKRRAKTRNR